jgi:tripartite-type tricarboxylate transporter receptor subunit TctC
MHASGGYARALVTAAMILLHGYVVAAVVADSSDYPSRPIRMLLPYPAGGSGDLVGRLVAQRLTVELKQSVVVDNRSGASGLIGTELAAKSPPDGYTILLATSTNAINSTLFPKLPYDFARDFTAISPIARTLQMLVVHPGIPARTISEFVAYARSRQGSLSYVSSGTGTSGHLAMEVLKKSGAMEILHVPHKGNAPALNDLLGGQVAAMFSNVVTVVPHVRAGKLRALGVSGLQRSILAPDVPTVAESGYPGFEVIAWFGVVVRVGVAEPIVHRLNAAMNSLLSAPDVQERLLNVGAEPMSEVRTPQQFQDFIRRDIPAWARMIRDAGVRVD